MEPVKAGELKEHMLRGKNTRLHITNETRIVCICTFVAHDIITRLYRNSFVIFNSIEILFFACSCNPLAKKYYKYVEILKI